MSIQKLASQAYTYGFPLVLMDISRKSKAVNRFQHLREFPDDTFTDVVSPNADTLYSSAWLDLSEGPLILSLPDTNGRYYLMEMLDAWTNVFASPGKRTTGTQRVDFVIVGPTYRGPLPEGVREIRSPTNLVWILGRTQTNGKKDYDAVHAIQDQYRLTPLSARTQKASTPERSGIKTAPVDQAINLDAVSFFKRLNRLMQDNPPAEADAPIVNDLKKIGIEPGKAFDPDPSLREALQEGARAGLATILGRAKKPFGIEINGWDTVTNDTEQLGTYGTDYAWRAVVALIGLGANLTADAVYPRATTDVEGEPLNGAHRYAIHFEFKELPPVNAFWSLTLYNEKQFFVKNPINRFAIGDRDALKRNDDGSIDLFIQNESPGPERESNWLPAPKDGFNLLMRLYWPKSEVLTGEWRIPPIRKVKKDVKEAA